MLIGLGERVMLVEAFGAHAVDTFIAAMMVDTQRYQRLVIALSSATGAQVMQLDRAGLVWAEQAQAGHAAKAG